MFGIVHDDAGERLGISGNPEYAHRACDGSLKRLDTDYIDLYYQHRINPDTPIEGDGGRSC